MYFIKRTENLFKTIYCFSLEDTYFLGDESVAGILFTKTSAAHDLSSLQSPDDG